MCTGAQVKDCCLCEEFFGLQRPARFLIEPDSGCWRSLETGKVLRSLDWPLIAGLDWSRSCLTFLRCTSIPNVDLWSRLDGTRKYLVFFDCLAARLLYCYLKLPLPELTNGLVGDPDGTDLARGKIW